MAVSPYWSCPTDNPSNKLKPNNNEKVIII